MPVFSFWRADVSDTPYFGTGSYWALSEDVARHMASFFERAGVTAAAVVNENSRFRGLTVPARLGWNPRAIYMVEVDIDDDSVLDLRGRRFPDDNAAPKFARRHAEKLGRGPYTWVIFDGGSEHIGETMSQAVYLGESPLLASRVATK